MRAKRKPQRAWTDAEINALITEGPRIGCTALAKQLGRSTLSLYAKARALGVVFAQPNKRPWSAEEIAIVTEGVRQRISDRKLGEMLNRSPETVRKWRIRNNEPSRIKAIYSEEEIARIRAMRAADRNWSAIAAELGRSPSAIRTKAINLGIPPAQGIGRRASPERIAMLRLLNEGEKMGRDLIAVCVRRDAYDYTMGRMVYKGEVARISGRGMNALYQITDKGRSAWQKIGRGTKPRPIKENIRAREYPP